MSAAGPGQVAKRAHPLSPFAQLFQGELRGPAERDQVALFGQKLGRFGGDFASDRSGKAQHPVAIAVKQVANSAVGDTAHAFQSEPDVRLLREAAVDCA